MNFSQEDQFSQNGPNTFPNGPRDFPNGPNVSLNGPKVSLNGPIFSQNEPIFPKGPKTSSTRKTKSFKLFKFVRKVAFMYLLSFCNLKLRPPTKKDRRDSLVFPYKRRVSQPLAGAAFQTQPANPISSTQELRTVITNVLTTAGIPIAIVVTATSTVIAFLLTVVSLIKVGKNGARPWIISSLVLQAISFASMAITMICGNIPDGFLTFVEEKATEIISTVAGDRKILSLADLRDRVMTQAQTIQQGQEMMDRFKRENPTTQIYYPPLVLSPFVQQLTTELTRAQLVSFEQWCILNYPSVQFWTPTVLQRLWTMDDFTQRVFMREWGIWSENKLQASRPAPESLPERPQKPQKIVAFSDTDTEPDIVTPMSLVPKPVLTEEENENQSMNTEEYDAYEQFLAETGQLPGYDEVDTTYYDPLQGARKEEEVGLCKWLINQVIGLIISVCACVSLQMSGKSVDFGTLMNNWKGIDFLTTKFSDACEKLAEGAAGKTAAEVAQETLQEHIRALNTYIEIPATTYAMQPDLRTNFCTKLAEVETFLKLPMNPKLADKGVLSSLYGYANNFKTEIVRAAKDQTLRVEPRLFLFVGQGGVGKTKTMQNLSAYFAKHLYPTLDPNRVALGVTVRDKYYPLFNGEKIWMCDEVAGSKDFKDDLIMRDLRGLCSSARFGASTAEITGKDQMASPEIILGTTNSHPDSILDRLVELGGAESVEPCAARMHIWMCERNEQKYGKLDPMNRDTQQYDRSGNMDHVLYRRYIFNPATKKYTKESRVSTYKEVRNHIIAVRNNLSTQHQELMVHLQGAQRQFVSSRQHFCVNLYGLPWSGKGKACDEMVPDIQKKTGYKVCYIHKEDLQREFPRQKHRIILVIDDIFPCEAERRKDAEAWYMDVYNNALLSGSIIILTTNIRPSICLPSLEVVPFEYTVVGRSVPFVRVHGKSRKVLQVSEPGFLRRIGFTGNFVDNTTHTTDLNFHVKNDRYYQQNIATDYLNVTLHCMLFILTLPLLYYSLWSILVLVVIVIYTYCRIVDTNVKIFTRIGLPTQVFLSYQNFLKTMKEVSVVHGAVVISEQPVIALEAREFNDIDLTTKSLVTNIYSDWNLYSAQNKRFKIYVANHVAEYLLAQSKRLRVAYPESSVEAIVDLMKTLRNILAATGQQGAIHAKIGDIGEVYLKGNVVTVDRRTAETNQYHIVTHDGGFSVVPFEEVYGHAIPQTISWHALAAFHISGVPLVDLTDTHMENVNMVMNAALSATVLTDQRYMQARTDVMNQNLTARAEVTCMNFKNYLDQLLESTPGKVALGVATALVVIVSVYGIYRLFSSGDSSDSDSEEELFIRKKKQRRHPTRPGKGKSRAISEDERRPQMEEQRVRKRTQPKERQLTDDESRNMRGQERVEETPYVYQDNGKPIFQPTRQMLATVKQKSHDEVKRSIPQSVDTLGQMNGYSAFSKYLSSVGTKVEKNECWCVASKQDVPVIEFTSEEDRNRWASTEGERCYGLFIEGRYLVTVAHLVTHAQKFKKNIYVLSDQFGKTAYKVELVKSFEPEDYRDIAIMHVIDKKCQSFTSLRKNFHENAADHGSFDRAVLKRYAGNRTTGNTKEYLYGTFTYEDDEVYDAEDADGNPFKLAQYGVCWFSFSSFVLTSAGDCGLPYFVCREGGSDVKLAGIHCMGNVAGVAVGIVARLYQKDMHWIDHFTQRQTNDCKWCNENEIYEEEPLPEKAEAPGHSIVWNNEHNTGVVPFLREVRWKIEGDKNFVGKIRKSSGESAKGTVEHSHTHFVPATFINHQHTFDATRWYLDEEPHYGGKILQTSFKASTINMIEKILAKLTWMEEFVLIGNRNYMLDKKGNPRRDDAGNYAYYFSFDLLVTKHTKTQKEVDAMVSKPARQIEVSLEREEISVNGETMYAPAKLLQKIQYVCEETGFADIPINQNGDNATTFVLGSFRGNQSPLPKDGYERVPGCNKFVTKSEKLPIRLDSHNAPEHQAQQLVCSNYGEPCPRVTQTVQWQGKVYRPDINVVMYVREQMTKRCRLLYSNMRELTDHEVLHGPKGEYAGGLSSLELKKSVGWSLASLFWVTTKDDIISVDDEGKYSWRDNPAADFAREWYRNAKKAVRNGVRPLTIYNELVKMEKLKIGKEFLGRIFCSADLMGVLIQRKFLGAFVSISTAKDVVIGVGSNPWHVYNEMAFSLLKKGNYFTGDYKRWDKTVPRVIFEELGIILDNLNDSKTYSLLFKDVYKSFHVSGHTLFQKTRGMPSGALVTANLNSLCNEYALYTAWAYLAQKHGKDPSIEAYQENVYRKFYGDDVVIGVTDKAIEWYNLITVSKTLETLFGFRLDSSEKNEDDLQRQMSFNELSWCSRYFRQLDDFNFYVGALKKSTIISMLHYKKKTSDEVILAATLNVAIYEAAAWNIAFFRDVVEDVRTICTITPGVGKYVEILTRHEYQRDMFDEGLLGRLKRHLTILLDQEDDRAASSTLLEGETNNIQEIRSKNIIETVLRLYRNQSINLQKAIIMGNTIPKFVFTDAMVDAAAQDQRDYVSALNLKAQAGEISMPEYIFAQQADLAWYCECTTRQNVICAPLTTGIGYGQNKRTAKFNAAFQVYYQLFGTLAQDQQMVQQFEKTIAAEKKKMMQQAIGRCHQQMNMSPGDAVPSVKSGGIDMTVTGGTAVFSNTMIGNGVTDLNPVAFSLNNIAQTGAPFDIKDSVYHIFQVEQMTSVSGTQSVGSEVFRLSLDPKTRPAIHQAYINMHDNHVPSVDFGVWINGTAGALGTLKIGYVTDISKVNYTLTEIQQIASQDVTLSQPSTVSFVLRDIRQKSLYRKVVDDEEKYPGIVALVSSQITNVQRNDAVTYPIQILSKLNPEYILATPVAIQNSGPTVTTINLDSYFSLPTFDVVINENEVPNSTLETYNWPDNGWLTGLFKPTFTIQNLIGVGVRYRAAESKGIVMYLKDTDVPAEPVELGQTLDAKYSLAEVIVFGYGNLPIDKFKIVKANTAYAPTINDMAPNASIYSIQPFVIQQQGMDWQCSQVAVYPEGVAMFFVNASYGHSPSPLVTNAQVFVVKEGKISLTNAKFLVNNDDVGQNQVMYFPKNGVYNVPLIDTTVQDISALKFAAPRSAFANLPTYHVVETWANKQAPTYVYTWLGTGNNVPTSAAPVGMSVLSFVRPGTSLDKGMPIVMVETPGYQKLANVLSRYQESISAEWLQMSFYSDAVNAEFQCAYRNGVFLVRSSQVNMIRTSLLTSTCVLRDIKASSSATGVSMVPISTWNSWITTASFKFANKLALQGARKQAEMGMIAAQGIGSMLTAGAQMGLSIWQMKQQQQVLEQNRQFQMRMQASKNFAQLRNINQTFENSMSLKGLSGASGNTGNLQTSAVEGSAPTKTPLTDMRQMQTAAFNSLQDKQAAGNDASASANLTTESGTEMPGTDMPPVSASTSVDTSPTLSARAQNILGGPSSHHQPMTWLDDGSDDDMAMTTDNDKTPLISGNKESSKNPFIQPAQRMTNLPGLNDISLKDVSPKISFPGGSRQYTPPTMNIQRASGVSTTSV